MVKVYISGAGMTRFGKRKESLTQLVSEAVQNVRMNSDISYIDAIFFGAMNPEEFTGDTNISTMVTDNIGLTRPSVRIETASSTGAAVFHAAYFAVACGRYRTVLVAAGEKMTLLPTENITGMISKVISPLERVTGATMPALAALITRRYMHDFNLDRETLALVAVKNHKNALLNPYAHFHKEVNLDMVLKSRLVADPLRLYDCAPLSDGACAIVLTSRKTDVKVAGLGHATDTLSLAHRDVLSGFKSTQIAAKRAYSMAGIGAQDIDVAEVHDAFTTFEIIGTEDLGFFKQGNGGNALKEGVTSLEGDIPVNTSGGLKAKGHPVGVSGLAQIAEVHLQLMGNAGKRQVDGVRSGLAQSIGGLANNNLVTILKVCS
jgi:acetyl-CoA acetyltransferase